VVTIHDTIIQYDEDHYPEWRHPWEYAYWSKMLKHTLLNADRIMTVSESSKDQIERFMARHSIRSKPIIVTYEPCLYESLEQPVEPHKENYVIHLASSEPHKRTAHLIRWWHEAEMMGRELPTLHLIGSVPEEVVSLLADSHSIVRRAFLSESALQAVYLEARALILPSEIEGFGLPALEAYYLGTPVCYVKGTSVEEVLKVATSHGGFTLDDSESLFSAVSQVMSMTPQEVRECGLKLREVYAAEKVIERMMAVFQQVRNCKC
jgi:glycosyltransferase involved in cell wall biosynthesis